MRTDTAIRLINCITYKRGWEIRASDYTDRHATGVRVTVRYPTVDYARAYAPNYGSDGEVLHVPVEFVIVAGLYKDDVSLYRAVLENLIKIEVHEIREAFRVGDKYVGIFNPHEPHGMANWGDVEGDVQFGNPPPGSPSDYIAQEMTRFYVEHMFQAPEHALLGVG